MSKRYLGDRYNWHREKVESGQRLAIALGKPQKSEWPASQFQILPIVEKGFDLLDTDLETPMAVTNHIYAWLQSPERRS